MKILEQGKVVASGKFTIGHKSNKYGEVDFIILKKSENYYISYDLKTNTVSYGDTMLGSLYSLFECFLLSNTLTNAKVITNNDTDIEESKKNDREFFFLQHGKKKNRIRKQNMPIPIVDLNVSYEIEYVV